MSWEPNPWQPDARVRRGFVFIGGLVKRRREELGISQRELERRSGVDQTVLSRLENGKLYGFRWQRFARIVDALGGLDDAKPPYQRPPWPGSDTGGPPDRVALRAIIEEEMARFHESLGE